MIKAGIVGATGYTGVELIRLLGSHPHVTIEIVTSRSESGKSVAQVFPSLRGAIDAQYVAPDIDKLSACDLVFFATPNGTAMESVPALISAGTKVIDLSADFRIKDPAVWSAWYGMEHRCPDLLAEAVYGLPEINRDKIAGAQLVANPGCYPTAVQLGFLPLLKNQLVEPGSLIADAKSGVSGAGRKASINHLYTEVSDAFAAYAADGHRHLPEIKQGLESVINDEVGLVFVPHLVPMNRGIHATLYATLKNRETHLQQVFEEFYQQEPFVDVLPVGSHPDTSSVRGNNIVRMACHKPQNGNTAVILVVEDNLVKGAAGQAIQNMNLMQGLEETTGLIATAAYP
ncbi:MAG: N-acetyl-gamma-glutamyl-phosphate reductase [Gammaproteobacteria bacterium]|nr:N-acetyl-gamma-glutamyl-phosphate reductase [Gammaproteobacteria bacterium]